MNELQCNVVQLNVIQCSVVQCSLVYCNTPVRFQYSRATLYSTLGVVQNKVQSGVEEAANLQNKIMTIMTILDPENTTFLVAYFSYSLTQSESLLYLLSP